jgi:AbrB family looped-hinge helix DNA binding protein
MSGRLLEIQKEHPARDDPDSVHEEPLFSPVERQPLCRLNEYGISVNLYYGISDRRCAMKGNIVVSARGQITLPASMRRRLGIKAGGVLVVEDREGELVLRPAAVVELDTYTDEEIGRWEREDRLAPGERSRILKQFGHKR